MNKAHNPQLTPTAKMLRKNMTPEEKHLWYDFLKKLPQTVYRQKVIGPYIVDFYVACPQTVIEVDGVQHGQETQQEKDRVRDAYLQAQGCRVLRYANWQVKQNFADVCEDIYRQISNEDAVLQE